MRTPSAMLLAVALAGALVPGAGAQGPRGESLTGWEWYQEVQPPDKGKPYAMFVLTPSVFDKARPDLFDLRLYDGHGKEVPYALRVRKREDVKQEITARTFNQVTHADRSVEVSLDLGESHGEHNEIDVRTTPAREFRRRLRVDGSDDGKAWSNVLDRTLAHFEADGQTLDVRRFTYDRPSRFRYLRVRVYPAGGGDDKLALTSVAVFHEVHDPGDYRTLPAVLEARQPVPGDGGPGSAWFIHFGDYQLAPCEKLTLDVDDDEFVRAYRVEVYNPEGSPQPVMSGELRRQAGEPKKPLEIAFPSEVTTARRLRLVVTDQRNPPLNLRGVQYTAAARQVIFRTPDAPDALRLYFGNPKAPPPGYDFAATLPTKVDAGETELSQERREQPNPTYLPPPKPWTERWPWLVYVVLGAASLVLLALLGLLGREAIARHGAAPQAPNTREE